MKFFNGGGIVSTNGNGHVDDKMDKKRGFSLIYVSTAFNSLRRHSQMIKKPKSASISHDIYPEALKKRITDPELLFKREYLVGKGTFGHVYKVTDRGTGAPLAAKIIDLEKSTQDLEDVQQEIIVLSQCNSPYIIEYFASYVKNHSLWIMMEYVDGTSAKQLAKSGLLQEKHIGVIIRETLKGLDYLHTNALKIHRDIKAANILISLHGEVKLADFGVAGQLSESVTKRASLVGSPFWMAPEIIKDSEYTFKADIWSLGICSIELAAKGSPPYVHLHPMKAMISIAEDPSPCLESTLAMTSSGDGIRDAEKFSSKFKCFIDLCLNKEPDQ
uniref:non-specific serine/threonine protein kinase n=1 Tax=Romanomermis culicivorax TaxID=13658 RepID=A0A915K1Z2_ROMCU